MRLEQDESEPLFSTLIEESMLDLVELFVADLPKRVAAIESALRDNDIDLLASLAHQLKGSAGGYGFPSIREAAMAIETDAHAATEMESLEAQVTKLIGLCRRVRMR